jgi:hypothetical protein
MANETQAFAAHFKVEGEEEAVVTVAYNAGVDALEAILSHDWDRKRFRPDQILGCDYRQEFVAWLQVDRE